MCFLLLIFCYLLAEYAEGHNRDRYTDEPEWETLNIGGVVKNRETSCRERGGDDGAREKIELSDADGEYSWDGELDKFFEIFLGGIDDDAELIADVT